MMRALAAALLLAGTLAAQPAVVATLASAAPANFFVLARSGKSGAAVCDDHKLRVWALPEGRLLRTIDLAELIDAAAMSGDGAWIAVGDHSGGYTVWNAATGAQQLQFRMAYYPFALAFSADAKRLAIAPAGEPVQIYDVASRAKLFELEPTVGGTAAVAFSGDGSRIATADADTIVRIYDGGTGKLLARNTDFLLEPLAVSFTADGKRVLAGGGDLTIALLDAATGSAVRKSAKLTDPVIYLEVSPDGQLAAAGLMHAANMLMAAPLIVSEVESGRKVQEWLPAGRMLGGGWTVDGHLLAATNSDSGLQIWRVR
jgi:WD40 repeat protein